MRATWKLPLGILLALVVTGCAPPASAPAGKIYFDLKSDPSVLVNELGVDITLDEKSLCYALVSQEGNVSGWIPVILLGSTRVGTPFPNEGNTGIRSGSSVPNMGVCRRSIEKWKGLHVSAWMYQKNDEPNRRFAVYSDNVDPAAASLHLPVTTAALASSPFQVRVQNTSSMTISVPLNCRFIAGRDSLSELALVHLERQTTEGWEVFRTALKNCSGTAPDSGANEAWLDIAPQMNGTVDLRSAYPADFVLEKGRYRWVTIFCDERQYCYTSFSPTFDYPREQAQ